MVPVVLEKCYEEGIEMFGHYPARLGSTLRLTVLVSVVALLPLAPAADAREQADRREAPPTRSADPEGHSEPGVQSVFVNGVVPDAAIQIVLAAAQRGSLPPVGGGLLGFIPAYPICIRVEGNRAAIGFRQPDPRRNGVTLFVEEGAGLIELGDQPRLTHCPSPANVKLTIKFEGTVRVRA